MIVQVILIVCTALQDDYCEHALCSKFAEPATNLHEVYRSLKKNTQLFIMATISAKSAKQIFKVFQKSLCSKMLFLMRK